MNSGSGAFTYLYICPTVVVHPPFSYASLPSHSPAYSLLFLSSLLPLSFPPTQKKCGLPIHTYFSALKLRWLMDNIEGVHSAIEKGTCLFGTVDTWIIWVK